MQNGIKVQVSGVTRSDDWYGDDVNVYVSLPESLGNIVWNFADMMKAESVRTHVRNGRVVAKYPNVNREDALDVAHFIANV